MGFLLSKLLPQFVYPVGFSVLLGLLAGLAGFTGRRRLATVLGGVAVLVIWVCATPAVSLSLQAGLERHHPPVPVAESPEADAIVVLGGAVRDLPSTPKGVDLGEAADRVLHAARLYRAGKAPMVIAAGGSASLLGTVTPEAEVVAELLQEWDVPRDAIRLDRTSLNTRQNAVNVRAIAREEGVDRLLLVTSASHMRRAVAVFRELGMEVVPAPTDYQTLGYVPSILDWIPDAEALYGTTVALKEYIGMWVYQIRGWA